MEMRERLELIADGRIYSLDHEHDAFYYVINDDVLARVSFDATTDACTIKISTEACSHLQGYVEELITDNVPTSTNDPYGILVKVSQLAHCAADSIIELYAVSPQDAPHIVNISAPVEIDELVREEAAPDAFETLPEVSGNTFGDLGGLEAQKRRLMDIGDCVNDPFGAARYNLTASHFILYGPAGTGKTSLVEAFGHYIGAPVRQISSADIMRTLVGESGLQLKQVFEEAFKQSGKLVLFFDEIDSIAGKPGSDSKSNVEVKNLLKKYITTTKNLYPNIVIAGATNLDLSSIDDAIVRSGRLEGISVPKPNEAERCDIWANLIIQQLKHSKEVSLGEFEQIDIGTLDVPELARITEDMTGADITHILEQARRACYRQYRQTGIDQYVTQTLLVDIIRHFHQR